MMIAFFSKILNLGSSNSKPGVPKRDTNLPCKRVVCTKSTLHDQSNLLKKSDVKPSSSKTTRTWNGSCNRLLCLFGESKSEPSSPSQVSFMKMNETKSSLARPSVSVTRVKSVETSSKVQCDCKNDSRAVMTGSKQSNPSSLKEVVPPAVVEMQIQNIAGPKDPPMRNLSSNNLEASQIGIQRREREIPAPSTEKIDTAKNHTSSSQKQPWSDEPVYHIRWEGYEKERELSGQNCMLCVMDLSIWPSGNNDEHLENNDYDDEYYDEHQCKPQLLPAVDILSYGHVFHTECSTDFIADEQSTDPKCIFCLSMA